MNASLIWDVSIPPTTSIPNCWRSVVDPRPEPERIAFPMIAAIVFIMMGLSAEHTARIDRPSAFAQVALRVDPNRSS